MNYVLYVKGVIIKVFDEIIKEILEGFEKLPQWEKDYLKKSDR